MGSRPCCCIPNRAATIFLSLCAILVASLFLAATVTIISSNSMNKPLIVPAIIFGFTNLLLWVASWVGFLGAILRKRRAVAFYATILTILWVCTLVIGLWNIVVIFKNRNSVIDSCVAKTYAQARGGPFDSKSTKNDCTHAHNVLAGAVVGVWVLYQLLDLWFITVVYALRRDLLEKELANKRYLEQSYTINTAAAAGAAAGSAASIRSGRSSEESKMSARAGPAVSVPYRPTGGRAPMGPYVSRNSAAAAGVPVQDGTDASHNRHGDTGSAHELAHKPKQPSIRRVPPPPLLPARPSEKSSSSPPAAAGAAAGRQAKRLSMGRTIKVTIDPQPHDNDWHHELTPESNYEDAPLSAQPGSIFQSRYDQRYH